MRLHLDARWLVTVLTVSVTSVASAHADAQSVEPPAIRPLGVMHRGDFTFVGGAVMAAVFASQLDRSVAGEVMEPGTGRSTLQRTARFGNTIGGIGPIALSASMLAAGRLAHRPALAQLGVRSVRALALSTTATMLLKGVVGRARPYATADDPDVFSPGSGFAHHQYASFPSGHTSTAFAVATALTLGTSDMGATTHRVVAFTSFAAASTIGMSRLYLNQHWTSDVIAGASIGIASGIIGERYARRHDAGAVRPVDTTSTAARGERARTSGRFAFVTDVPGALGDAARSAATRSAVPGIVAIAATTAGFLIADDRLYSGTQRAARAIHLAPDHPEWALRVGGAKLFAAPTSISSALYYLGDGWTTMGVAGALYTSGKLRHQSRAVSTAGEITESMLALGVVTQFLKHATGRQTPGSATVPGGRWRPFANWKTYSDSTPQFDAFPSGHLATAMSTVTVLAANYPEIKWIKPVGYTLMGALSFQMVNSGVHWMSDYPLALGIGAVVGKAVVRRHDNRATAGGVAAKSERRFEPILEAHAIGLRMLW